MPVDDKQGSTRSRGRQSVVNGDSSCTSIEVQFDDVLPRRGESWPALGMIERIEYR